MRAAISMLWVAITAARPEARTSWVSAENTCSEVRGSRFPVGSSASRMRGAVATARAVGEGAGRVGARAREGAPLPLPPRQLARPMGQPLLEAEIAEQLAAARR